MDQLNLEIMSNVISKRNIDDLKILENFPIDYKIEALLDISDTFSSGNTIVVHSDLGPFIVKSTTKQIMNEMYTINGVGFAMTKFLVNFYGITHYTPFVYGKYAYMPMTGASRKNADWIAIDALECYEQIEKTAYFITKSEHKIQMDFPRGNLERRLHKICFLVKCSITILEKIINVGGCCLEYTCNHLFATYDRCRCDLHSRISLLNNLPTLYFNIIEFILLNEGIDELGQSETKKFYHQNLVRIKKLY